MSGQGCAAIDERLLVDYADGELDPVQVAEVESHLAESPEARRCVAAYRASLAELRAGIGEPPAAAASDLEAIRRRTHTLRTRRLAVAPLAGLAAACIVAGVVWMGRGVPEQAVSEADARAQLAALDTRLTELEGQMAALRTKYAMQAAAVATIPPVDSAGEETAAVVLTAGRYWEGRNDITRALTRYRDILKYYPSTYAAAEAQQRINVLAGPSGESG